MEGVAPVMDDDLFALELRSRWCWATAWPSIRRPVAVAQRTSFCASVKIQDISCIQKLVVSMLTIVILYILPTTTANACVGDLRRGPWGTSGSLLRGDT